MVGRMRLHGLTHGAQSVGPWRFMAEGMAGDGLTDAADPLGRAPSLVCATPSPLKAIQGGAMIHLHYWPTPNGKKVTIFLEETGLEHRIVPCNIGRGDQFDPAFLKLNPNHRMPVLVDDAPTGGGEPIAVFESGAILLYLAEKTGRFWATDVRGRTEITQWVLWQAANQGPKTGELGHFRGLKDKGDQSYAVRRFSNEVNRLYGVLDNRLYDRRYLAGSEYTIADIMAYPWTVYWERQGQNLADFPYFKRWFDELSARPAVQRGLAVGGDMTTDVAQLPPEEQERRTKLLYEQRALPAPKTGGITP
jgi:GST-like protein